MRMFALVSAFCFAFFTWTGNVFADDFDGILPSPSREDVNSTRSCSWARAKATEIGTDQNTGRQKEVVNKGKLETNLKKLSVGTKIKGGCVQLSDIPVIIIGLIDLLTKIAGTIAVGFIVYAGFQLIMSGLTENREAAKNTIKYAIGGLVLSLLAWVIVNVIQVQLTL